MKQSHKDIPRTPMINPNGSNTTNHIKNIIVQPKSMKEIRL